MRDGNAAAGHLLKGFCPGMLAGAVDSVPDLLDFSGLAEVVDVPVRAGSQPQVVAQAPLQPAGSESAADINVDPRLECESSESTYL